MEASSFFKQWLDGRYCMPDLDDFGSFKPDLDFLIWLVINHKVPFYQIRQKNILGLEDAWINSRKYYRRAIALVTEYSPYMSLDREEGLEIIETLGDPPDVSHPIYIITVDDGKTEEVVYVGKSASNHSRFKGGHATAIKLLDPKYDGMQKFVYFCQIMLNSTTDEYLPLEFLGDKPLAHEILDDVETMVINKFKPIFNSMKMKSYKVKNTFQLSFQNAFTDSRVLTDIWIEPKI